MLVPPDASAERSSGNKMQRRTEMVEMLVGIEALEGMVLTVLEHLRMTLPAQNVSLSELI